MATDTRRIDLLVVVLQRSAEAAWLLTLKLQRGLTLNHAAQHSFVNMGRFIFCRQISWSELSKLFCSYIYDLRCVWYYLDSVAAFIVTLRVQTWLLFIVLHFLSIRLCHLFILLALWGKWHTSFSVWTISEKVQSKGGDYRGTGGHVPPTFWLGGRKGKCPLTDCPFSKILGHIFHSDKLDYCFSGVSMHCFPHI